MKKFKYLFVVVLSLFLITSCSNEENNSTQNNSNTTQSDTYEKVQKTHEVNLRNESVDEENSKSITLNTSNYFSTNYSTGSFGEKNGIEYYRCYHTNAKIMTKLLTTPSYVDGEINSSFYNVDNLKGIYEMNIVYKSTKGLKIYYSKDRSYSAYYTAGSSESMFDLTIRLDYQGFFKVETLGAEVEIESFTLKYNSSVENNNSAFLTYSDTRIDQPYTDFDNIKSGETRKIANSITINSDNTYTINSYKSYTYYTFDDIVSNPSLVSSCTYTDPVDVANYYTLFNAFPLNYGSQSDAKSLSIYFGDNTRCFFQYSRTDGYARSVPYYASGYNPIYYELDFNEDSTYTTSNRGKGRLVIWTEGFRDVDYMGQSVIVYTDDHYATFKEYNNYGSFGTRFNAERSVTGLKWSEPTTLKNAI